MIEHEFVKKRAPHFQLAKCVLQRIRTEELPRLAAKLVAEGYESDELLRLSRQPDEPDDRYHALILSFIRETFPYLLNLENSVLAYVCGVAESALRSEADLNMVVGQIADVVAETNVVATPYQDFLAITYGCSDDRTGSVDAARLRGLLSHFISEHGQPRRLPFKHRSRDNLE
jgi:hypothetical protein